MQDGVIKGEGEFEEEEEDGDDYYDQYMEGSQVENEHGSQDIDDNRDGNNLSDLNVDVGEKEESYTADEEHQETSYDSQYDHYRRTRQP